MRSQDEGRRLTRMAKQAAKWNKKTAEAQNANRSVAIRNLRDALAELENEGRAQVNETDYDEALDKALSAARYIRNAQSYSNEERNGK